MCVRLADKIITT